MNSATLQVRCGDDIRERLVEAGIEGDYLSFPDPAWPGLAGTDAAAGRRAAIQAFDAGDGLSLPECDALASLAMGPGLASEIFAEA